MLTDITIMIPTMGRVNKQKTLSELSSALSARTILLVEDDEFDDHDIMHGSRCNVLALPTNIKGIADIRQYAVDICKTPFLFLIDDDMVFFKRKPDSVKLERCTTMQQEELFKTLVEWLDFDEFPLVGLSARQGNNHVEQDYREATRQMNFHGINISRFNDLGLKFNGSEVMEDFNLVLSLLTKGIPNRVMYQYCWNQLGSGAIGGCSQYRTPELQRECAEQLEFDYPDFVTVVEKTNKTGWKGLETRTDVRVQWQKAYQWGLANAM